MFAKITTYRCDPERLDEMAGKLDQVKARVAEISGLIDVYTAWREDGDGITVAIYESQADAAAAMPHVQAVWDSLAGFLTSAPSAEFYVHVAHLKS